MVYVKHFDILGIDTKQIPCIELQGVPTTATEGAVGLFGMNMLSTDHEIYVCIAVNGNVYTWIPLKGEGGVTITDAKINDIGELIITLSNGTMLNAGDVTTLQEIEKINAKIDTLHANSFVVVATLPTASVENSGKIYLVPQTHTEDNNYYDEYISVSVDGVYSWEKIGSTKLDLSGYAPKSYVDEVASKLKLYKHILSFRLGIDTTNYTFVGYSSESRELSTKDDREKINDIFRYVLGVDSNFKQYKFTGINDDNNCYVYGVKDDGTAITLHGQCQQTTTTVIEV